LDVDRALFAQSTAFASPHAAALALIPYIERELAGGTRLSAITRHVLGLFRGVPGARGFRRYLATEAVKPGAGLATFRAALAIMVDNEARLTHIAAA
jgi:tRNA-dihydrouridine synthase A